MPPCPCCRAVTNAQVVAGLRCQARSQHSWQGGRTEVGVRGGRAYFEATVADEGLCRVGCAPCDFSVMRWRLQAWQDHDLC